MREDSLQPQHPEVVLRGRLAGERVVQDVELYHALPLLLLGGVVSGDLVVEESCLWGGGGARNVYVCIRTHISFSWARHNMKGLEPECHLKKLWLEGLLHSGSKPLFSFVSRTHSTHSHTCTLGYKEGMKLGIQNATKLDLITGVLLLQPKQNYIHIYTVPQVQPWLLDQL